MFTLAYINLLCLVAFFFFFLQPAELIRTPHPITGEIQVQKPKQEMSIRAQVCARFYTAPTSVSPSAPDQLRQEPRKPDRPCAAGKESGPERQRQLLRPFRQGLSSARERVRLSVFLWYQECPVCVSLPASVSLSCFLSPVSF